MTWSSLTLRFSELWIFYLWSKKVLKQNPGRIGQKNIYVSALMEHTEVKWHYLTFDGKFLNSVENKLFWILAEKVFNLKMKQDMKISVLYLHLFAYNVMYIFFVEIPVTWNFMFGQTLSGTSKKNFVSQVEVIFFRSWEIPIYGQGKKCSVQVWIDVFPRYIVNGFL